VGRDKILRTAQYFSRFYAWYLYRTNNPNSAIAPYAAIKTQFGLARKIMRAGKFVEHFKAAADLYDKLRATGFNVKADTDKVLQYLQIVRQLGYGFYLLLDTMTLPDAIGARKMVRAKKWQQQAYKAWFIGLASSALAGVYANYRLRERAKTVDEADGEGKVSAKTIERYVFCPSKWREGSLVVRWPRRVLC
jgi:peroxin-11B